MDIHVSIKSDRYGCLFACSTSTLFQFEFRKELHSWLFWLRGERDPEVFHGKTFPWDFFLDACRAKHFILNGGSLPNVVFVDSGKDLVEKQTR